MKNKGFTLLELIVVIVIVGVLSALALPRFFSTIEFSRSAEALASLMAIRKSMVRCGSYNDNFMGCNGFGDIDIENPGGEPGAHFSYAWVVSSADAFTITATRNATSGGNAGDTVNLTVSLTGIIRAGTTAFSGIK